MAVLKYQDRTLDVLSKQTLIDSLLYLEGFDPKNSVGTRLLDLIPKVNPYRDVNFVEEFYTLNGEAPDMLIVDFGGDCYMPTYLSAWKVEQYRDLDGSPYLGMKAAKAIKHWVYYCPEPETTPSVPDTWAAAEMTYAKSKTTSTAETETKPIGYDFDDYEQFSYFNTYNESGDND